ncbi:hypothetical protein PYW07_004216 [Mythimna separata]|uniref:VWFC domain-containing protein n=1 Tax=Mythimna separata TaxID=271217 RepID=A0AAD7YNL4_MYTSE|nr:hypothetical protein PYW07_004216 [Mythimna separata]
MLRSRGDMASPRTLCLLVLSVAALCRAGPLGPLPNVTSADVGLKEGSCALGDVVYMPGDEFPGSEPCERCTCARGDVQCARQRCEPRPGCKALHRPDHCCPTYQCECEQEGRVYGNGEKLVDPADPCRVCYCQGGEVVCRRIACFVRDDCTPRLVPGRCCPEYDNCPLRGVTSLPGMSSSISSMTSEKIETQPSTPKEIIKPEITIKEITPVSEIPVITDVKIKEILPSPSIEVAEYSSSKSPLIAREATSENNVKEAESRTDSPSIIEVHSSMPVIVSSPDATQYTDTTNQNEDTPPSKISFSTQDTANNAIYPSNVPIVATMGIPPATPEPVPVATTKAPIIEEEDFEHNPAFPPLPDDLAVLRNHEDEIVPEQAADNEHVSSHDITVASASPTAEPEVKELLTTTTKDLPDTSATTTTTESPKTSSEVTTAQADVPVSTEAPNFKESPMLNLRSAIPTEILNAPSMVPEEITGESDETTTVADVITQEAITTTIAPKKMEEVITEKVEISTVETKTSSEVTTSAPEIETTTLHKATETELEPSTKEQEQTTSSIAKSNVATEVTSQTELSSLPIETSDQNPPEVPENTTNDKEIASTSDPLDNISNTKIPATSSEVITVSRSASNENTGFENVETTEFIVEYGSSETATDAVELIKISAEPEKSAAIIESADGKHTNEYTDLMNLVRDVASISDNTEEPEIVPHVTTAASISDSEELIPVNAGYKSKNKNFNQNSITEIPLKSKIPNPMNKPKVEIEDDEESLTDSPPPFDKVEPTTRRPIIDHVSDDGSLAENKTDNKDIEIITQSYVPTFNRRHPTKVVLKKSNDDDSASSDVSASAETSTDTSASSNESPFGVSSETEGKEKLPSVTTQAPVSSESPIVTTAAPASSTDAASTSAPGAASPAASPSAGDAPSKAAPVFSVPAITTDAPASSTPASTTLAPASAEAATTTAAPPSSAQ